LWSSKLHLILQKFRIISEVSNYWAASHQVFHTFTPVLFFRKPHVRAKTNNNRANRIYYREEAHPDGCGIGLFLHGALLRLLGQPDS
jgi:hypothetical protein